LKEYENENEAAGVVLIQSNRFNFSFVCTKKGEEKVIRLIKCVDGEEEIIMEQPVYTSTLYLKVEAYGQDYSFYYGDSLGDYNTLIENVDGRILSADVAGGFVGTEIGLYASSNGTISTNAASFDWFEYIGLL
jgi:xylan 1,4-beta-xylosidase